MYKSNRTYNGNGVETVLEHRTCPCPTARSTASKIASARSRGSKGKQKAIESDVELDADSVMVGLFVAKGLIH